MNKEIDDWIRVFEVNEPQRHRKGFTVYKVISRVFHKKSIESITEMVSFKRFSEFKKLHKSLSVLHSSLHLKGVFPTFPDPKLFGRFDAEVIESRRQSALELLEFAAKYPPLFTNTVFVKFFENSVTNFTTLSTHNLLDSPTDEDNQCLPEPIEPNDDFSQRSGDNETSDGSSYYSTPIHSTDVSLNDKNLVNNNLTDFDPLVTSNTIVDLPEEQTSNGSKNWLISAIESSETNNTTNSSLNENNIEIPEPFAQTIISLPVTEIEGKSHDTNDILFVKQFSISCDDSDKTIEGEVSDQKSSENSVPVQNPIPNLIQNPVPNETIDSNDTYLLDAAIILRQAQQHEDNEEWEPAFESLKCAVGILLQGVVNETDSEKKASIRRKTYQYLTRAEYICDTYLSQTNSFQPSRRWAPDSPFKSLNSSLIQSWFGSSEELSKFKVIGIIDNKVQTVVDTTTNNIFIIKVIYRSNLLDNNNSMKQLSTNRLSVAQSIFPNDIPFMVQIYRIFKTEYALFLLLEFAKGGKLWDKICCNGYTCLSPCPDCTFNFDDTDYQLIADNVYSGRRLSRARSESGANGFAENNMNSIYETISEQQVLKKSISVESYSPSGSLVSIESLDCDIPSKSYISLCNNYAFNQKCADNTGLANCKVGFSSDSIDSIDSITECDSKSYHSYERSKKDKPLCKTQRQSSTESIGISGLLAKARGILKNVDQTLNLTKYVTKTPNFNYNRKDLRESKSEMSLSQVNQKRISEIFHQMDDNSECVMNRPQVSENEAKIWLSQLVRCLQHLHKLGIVYCDLKPENLLLTEDSKLCISYKCFWNESSPLHVIDETARERLYVAPELLKSHKISHLSDWWTFGVLAFELLTSRPLVSYYPNGITSHTSLYFPVFISLEAKDLIIKLLQPNPSERLGRHGSEEITTHPFFDGINWTNSS